MITRRGSFDELNGMRVRRTVFIVEAARIAGVSRRTIYNWLKAGRLEFIRTAGGSVRIYEGTLFQSPTRTFSKTLKEQVQ